MEEFEIALGADPAVKITYKPIQKFQQTSGMISKSKVYNYHQIIEIKNTKIDSIKITVTDQCPRTSNDKIKVSILLNLWLYFSNYVICCYLTVIGSQCMIFCWFVFRNSFTLNFTIRLLTN